MAVRRYKHFEPQIAASAYVDEAAVVIGEVFLGEDVSMWPFTVARGDVGAIRIGARTNVQDGSVLHCTQDNKFNPGGYQLTIGTGVTVGHNAVLHACTVGDYALIGMGAIVLDGARVGDRAMIGAGSVVSPGKELEGGFLWLGSPAKKIRPLRDAELEYLEYSAQHYINLKNNHLESIK